MKVKPKAPKMSLKQTRGTTKYRKLMEIIDWGRSASFIHFSENKGQVVDPNRSTPFNLSDPVVFEAVFERAWMAQLYTYINEPYFRNWVDTRMKSIYDYRDRVKAGSEEGLEIIFCAGVGEIHYRTVLVFDKALNNFHVISFEMRKMTDEEIVGLLKLKQTFLETLNNVT